MSLVKAPTKGSTKSRSGVNILSIMTVRQILEVFHLHLSDMEVALLLKDLKERTDGNLLWRESLVRLLREERLRPEGGRPEVLLRDLVPTENKHE